MEVAGLCGDPIIQCSAVPGSPLRVLTMPSVRARNHLHYKLESCPQTKPSPLRVPSGESGHFSVHLLDRSSATPLAFLHGGRDPLISTDGPHLPSGEGQDATLLRTGVPSIHSSLRSDRNEDASHPYSSAWSLWG